MARIVISELLDGKWEDGTRPKDLYELHISKSPATYVADIVAGLGSENKKVQNGCSELASLLSESHPELLYPHVELFLRNLDAKEPILRWEAVCTLGNLSKVDKADKTRASVDAMLGFLGHKSIVLQGHAVRALTKMVGAFPDVSPRVLSELIDAKDHFPGNRVGFVVEAMGAFAKDKKLAAKAKSFVEPYAKSEIKSVATKARKALKALSTVK